MVGKGLRNMRSCAPVTHGNIHSELLQTVNKHSFTRTSPAGLGAPPGVVYELVESRNLYFSQYSRKGYLLLNHIGKLLSEYLCSTVH